MRKIFIFILLLCCSVLRAQEYVIDMKHWDVKDGLPHRQVNCIYEDRQGFIWVGTSYGLSRFDGYHFTNYAEESDASLFNNVVSIAQDAKNNLWLVRDNNGKHTYSIFDPVTGKFSPLQSITGKLPDVTITSFVTFADSTMLVRTTDTNTYYTWRQGKEMSKWVIPPGDIAIMDIPERNCILAENDRQEAVLLGKSGNVLRSAKAPFIKGSESPFFSSTYNRYIRDKISRQYYLVTADLDIKDAKEMLPSMDPSISDDIFDLGVDNIVWRQGKLFHPGLGVLRDFMKEKVMSAENQTRTLLVDDKKRVWIGNDFGLYLLTVAKNKFRQYYNDTSKSVNHNSCRAIQEWKGSIYFVNEFHGLFSINESTHKTTDIFSGEGNLYALKRTPGGWLAGGIYEVRDNGAHANYKMSSDDYNNCWYIYAQDTSHYLLGLMEGLMWFNSKEHALKPFEQYNTFRELAKTHVLYIAPDRNGLLWICCNTGFYAYDLQKGIVARYSSKDTGSHYLPASEFQHYIQDASGTYWLASTNGLVRWDRSTNKYRRFGQADGLSNNNIYAVYDDDYGNLWMSSDYGIMKMNKASGAVNTYVKEDGITWNEFNRVAHYKDDSGNIYFGSLYGITVFNPKDFTAETGKKESASALAITSFLQFNGQTNKLEDKKESLVRDQAITMYPEDHFFTIEFSLLNYNHPDQTSYYWKIDGMDTGWTVQKDRTLRFSRLPYDMHTLHIKAQSADGSWSRNELTIQINVVRPFYLRLWFLFVALIAITATVIVGYNWRLYLLRRENERLDKIVREKTEDLRLSLQQKDILLKEIHHRVKNNLQVISSLLRLQSHSLEDEAAKNALLDGQNRILSIALIHQKLYQDEKLDTVEFAAFTDELLSQLKGVFGAGIEVRFINDIPETFLGIDTAVPLGLILNELITNSFKYAFKNVANPCIRLKLEHIGEEYKLTYADNGPGLQGDVNMERSKTLGLRLVSRLSKQLNGNTVYIKDDWSNFIISFRENKDTSDNK